MTIAAGRSLWQVLSSWSAEVDWIERSLDEPEPQNTYEGLAHDYELAMRSRTDIDRALAALPDEPVAAVGKVVDVLDRRFLSATDPESPGPIVQLDWAEDLRPEDWWTDRIPKRGDVREALRRIVAERVQP